MLIFITIISLVGTIFGIITFFEEKLKIWKNLYYIFLVRVFNRKPMEINLFLINNYDTPPSKKLNNDIFKKFKESVDNKTIELKKKWIRPDSIGLFIKHRKKLTTFDFSIRIDEEPKYLDQIEETEIISFNMVISIKPLRIYWNDLEHLNKLTTYISELNNITKLIVFQQSSPKYSFFTCNISRDFYFKKDKKVYKDKINNSKITINREKIAITGSNLLSLKSLVKSYYLKRR